MATIRVRPSGSVEAIIRRKSLPAPLYLTFETVEKAEAYCKEVEGLIDIGMTPPWILELFKRGHQKHDPLKQTVADIVRSYQLEYSVKPDDVNWLNVMVSEVGETRLDSVTVQWAADVIRSYKVVKQLKPATIRHRVGALRRCFDWASSMKGVMPINPLRLLPERYATYNDVEKKLLMSEGVVAPDSNNERDRRLLPGEEERIRKVLAGDKEYIKSIKVERALNPENSVPFSLMFELALETAMRMREIYTLTIDQIDIEQKTIFLDRTKNGDKRQVPLSSVAVRVLSKYLGEYKHESGRLFYEFWNGQLGSSELRKTTSRLSGRWRTVSRLAKCDDLHFHDLRHEATSRLYERTTLSDLKIAKITGHKDLKSLQRYSNLRASTLADEMW